MEATKVILYGHDGCPGTLRARAYLRGQGIPFVERDVTLPQHFAEMLAQGAYATPLLIFGPGRMVGFDAREFQRRWEGT